MHMIRYFLLAASLWPSVFLTWGDTSATDLSSPIGTWKSMDEMTGAPMSLVRIYELDGKLFARVEEVLVPGKENAVCTRCPADRKDQPLVGLVFMRRLKLINGEYGDGDILDPENGLVYECKLQLRDGGRKLLVRGFIGISLFGRSQIWERTR